MKDFDAVTTWKDQMLALSKIVETAENSHDLSQRKLHHLFEGLIYQRAIIEDVRFLQRKLFSLEKMAVTSEEDLNKKYTN